MKIMLYNLHEFLFASLDEVLFKIGSTLKEKNSFRGAYFLLLRREAKNSRVAFSKSIHIHP